MRDVGAYKEPLGSVLDHLPLNLSPETRQAVAQGASGYFAGATTVILTNPLDVIRTRLQIRSGGDAASLAYKEASIWSEAQALWLADGPRSLLRGIGPRYESHSCSTYAYPSVCI